MEFTPHFTVINSRQALILNDIDEFWQIYMSVWIPANPLANTGNHPIIAQQINAYQVNPPNQSKGLVPQTSVVQKLSHGLHRSMATTAVIAKVCLLASTKAPNMAVSMGCR